MSESKFIILIRVAFEMESRKELMGFGILGLALTESKI